MADINIASMRGQMHIRTWKRTIGRHIGRILEADIFPVHGDFVCCLQCPPVDDIAGIIHRTAQRRFRCSKIRQAAADIGGGQMQRTNIHTGPIPEQDAMWID